jgi:hypothetical protein
MSRSPTALLLPLALAATTALVGACGHDSSSSVAAPAAVGATAPADPDPSAPIQLEGIGAGTPLDAATYAMPLIGPDGPMRAVVDVPDGYFSSGGWVIDDGDGTVAPDEYGNLAFWGAVSQVDPDPCHDGPLTRVGPRVRDLAEALVSQRGRVTTAPRSVQLGGHPALYLESHARGRLHGCDEGEQRLFGVAPRRWAWLVDGIPGTTDRVWIVDVAGHRVVAAVQTMRGRTSDPAELVGIAHSVEFTHVGTYPPQPFRPGA